MKKFGLLTLGIIAGIVALANLGSLLALGVSAAIVFAGVHFYLKSESTFLKIFWASVGIVGLITTACKRTWILRYLSNSGSLVCSEKMEQRISKLFIINRKNR